ncbi:sensory box protein, partial [Vibrio parahaemolyticus V-223/04]
KRRCVSINLSWRMWMFAFEYLAICRKFRGKNNAYNKCLAT